MLSHILTSLFARFMQHCITGIFFLSNFLCRSQIPRSNRHSLRSSSRIEGILLKALHRLGSINFRRACQYTNHEPTDWHSHLLRTKWQMPPFHLDFKLSNRLKIQNLTTEICIAFYPLVNYHRKLRFGSVPVSLWLPALQGGRPIPIIWNEMVSNCFGNFGQLTNECSFGLAKVRCREHCPSQTLGTSDYGKAKPPWTLKGCIYIY